MGEQQGLWRRISTSAGFRIIGLCCVLPLCAISIVIPGPQPQPLPENATVVDWAAAAPSAREAWAREFTREHFGVDDLGRTRELVDYIDSLTEDPALDHADIRVMADAGAGLMRWGASKAPR